MAFETEVERGSTGITDAAPTIGTRPAASTVNPHRLLEFGSSAGTCQQASVNSTTVIGANRENQIYPAGQDVPIGYDRVTLVADQVVAEADWIKSYGAGRVGPAVTSDLAGDLLKDDAAGGGFGNQPANDGIEMVSSSASDITQTVTIYYTRNALGDTVFTETKTITGTSQVAFTHTDIELLLGCSKSANTVGTITLREASGNATITTMAPTSNTSGMVAATSTRAYNQAPTAVASDTTTKQIGLIGTDSTGAQLLDSQALTNTTAVTMNSKFNTVTFLLIGDIESNRTVDVAIGAVDTGDVIVGRALEAAAAQDDLIDCFLTHFVGAGAVDTSDLGLLQGLTDGVVTASKAVVVDANKDIGDFRNLDAVNFDAGASGTAGSLDVFPTTASKGKVSLAAADSAGDTTTTITNASQAGARTYTIPDAGASASFVMTEGAQTVNGNKTFGGSVIRTGQEYQASGPAKVGATAGWVVQPASNLYEATLPQSQTGSTLVVPVRGLKVGSTITAFKVALQIESAGNTVTVDADLRKLTNAAGDPVDASVGTIVQVSVTADTAVAAAKTGLSDVIGADEWFYILITATTGATTDIRYLGCTVTVTEA